MEHRVNLQETKSNVMELRVKGHGIQIQRKTNKDKDHETQNMKYDLRSKIAKSKVIEHKSKIMENILCNQLALSYKHHPYFFTIIKMPTITAFGIFICLVGPNCSLSKIY